MTEAGEKGTDWMFDQFTVFIRELITRDYPPLNKDEDNELDLYIEYNLMELLLETQVAFRFITREEILRLKKGMLQTPAKGISPIVKQSGMQRQQGFNRTG